MVLIPLLPVWVLWFPLSSFLVHGLSSTPLPGDLFHGQIRRCHPSLTHLELTPSHLRVVTTPLLDNAGSPVYNTSPVFLSRVIFQPAAPTVSVLATGMGQPAWLRDAWVLVKHYFGVCLWFPEEVSI